MSAVMNAYVTSPESRQHLRDSRYRVSREMVEADHYAARWDDGQTRGIAYRLTIAVGETRCPVYITDDAQVLVFAAEQWKCCGELDWTNDPEPLTTAVRMATDLATATLCEVCDRAVDAAAERVAKSGSKHITDETIDAGTAAKVAQR